MKLSTFAFINRRLTLSSRNKGIVHIISLISLIGVAVGTFALIVVLSVFNGFTDVAQSMLEKTCPPLLIEPSKGRIIDNLPALTEKIQSKEYKIAPIIKQTAMISTGEQRTIATVIGIDSSYFAFNRLDTCIVSGKDIFDIRDTFFCLMGINLAGYMGLGKGAEKMSIPVKITVPAGNSNQDVLVKEDKLSETEVLYSASYQTHSDMDGDVLFISRYKASELLNMTKNQCHNIFIIPNKKADVNKIQNKLKTILREDYTVKTILEQEPVYFRIVHSEKLAVYIIIAFIIFIAMINVISSVIILNIQKERMNKIFIAIGMRLKDLRKIYFLYGMSVNIAGCLSGILLGVILCLLQQHFGLVKLAKDTFVVDSFPVKIMLSDILISFGLVVMIGCVCISAVSSKIKHGK